MFIALLLYQGLVRANRNDRYWATRSLYHGSRAQSFMSRNRYKPLLGILNLSDTLTEDTQPKLKNQNVAIDERLVKS